MDRTSTIKWTYQKPHLHPIKTGWILLQLLVTDGIKDSDYRVKPVKFIKLKQKQ